MLILILLSACSTAIEVNTPGLTLTATNPIESQPTATQPVSPSVTLLAEPTASATPAITLTPTQTVNVTMQVERKTYPIYGSTEVELRKELDAKGIKDSFGTWDAYAAWDLGWTHDYFITEDNCRTDKIAVVVVLTYTLPEWNAPTDAPQELKDHWEKYMKAVATHEEGHRKIAVEAGEELYRSLAAMPPQYNCNILKKKTDLLGNTILELYNQKDIVYDLLTDHGETQGAIFP
jgi:predicted secreted Zn-dependent protease